MVIPTLDTVRLSYLIDLLAPLQVSPSPPAPKFTFLIFYFLFFFLFSDPCCWLGMQEAESLSFWRKRYAH